VCVCVCVLSGFNRSYRVCIQLAQINNGRFIDPTPTAHSYSIYLHVITTLIFIHSRAAGDWTSRWISIANRTHEKNTRNYVYYKYDVETFYRSLDSDVVRFPGVFYWKRWNSKWRRQLKTSPTRNPVPAMSIDVCWLNEIAHHLVDDLFTPLDNFSSEFRRTSPFCSAAKRYGCKKEGRGDEDGSFSDWRHSPASSASRVQSRHAASNPGTCLTDRRAGGHSSRAFHILCPLNWWRR